jgi:hypothetical protein
MSTDIYPEDERIAELSRPSEVEKQLVDLVRLDYDITVRALTGFVSAGAQIRAIGLAAWGVILGLAVRDVSPYLAGLALLVMAMFAYADAYHAALYRQALSRAVKLESLLDAYVDRLGISLEDPDAILRTQAKLENHRFGMNRTLKRLKARDLLGATPAPVFRVIYPMLAAVTAGLVIGYAV